jgi:hypothetical protein
MFPLREFAVWLVLTVLFGFALGLPALGLPCERLTEDCDLARGGLMPVGLLVMTLAPLLVARRRNGWRQSESPSR